MHDICQGLICWYRIGLSISSDKCLNVVSTWDKGLSECAHDMWQSLSK